MGSDQQFCLQWHNYQSSLLASLPQLLDSDDLTDVTLSAGGHNIKAHRVILSACSQYFKDLFKVLPLSQHPVIVLPGTNFTDLCALVTFMYSGEVNIYQEQLPGILTMADAMQIRGLAEVNGAAQNDFQARKDGYSSAKRPRLSDPQNSMLPVDNPVVVETDMKRPLLAESVDVTGSLMANSSFEIYGDTSRSLSNIQKNTQEELHFENVNKNESTKMKCRSEHLDLFVNVPRIEKGRKPTLYSESDVMHMEDTAYSSPNPTVQNSCPSGDAGIKQESEHHELIVSGGESNISHQTLSGSASAGDVQKLCGLDCENGQDQQSPWSDDSLGSNFGVESKQDRMQVGHCLKVTDQKFSAPYNKLNSTHSSKLFATCIVCGKQLSNQYNLRVHMETHQNVNYSCRVCNHVSRSRDALRKHVSYRHPKENKDRLSLAGIAREGGLLPTSNNSMSGNRKSKLFSRNDIKQ